MGAGTLTPRPLEEQRMVSISVPSLPSPLLLPNLK